MIIASKCLMKRSIQRKTQWMEVMTKGIHIPIPFIFISFNYIFIEYSILALLIKIMLIVRQSPSTSSTPTMDQNHPNYSHVEKLMAGPGDGSIQLDERFMAVKSAI